MRLFSVLILSIALAPACVADTANNTSLVITKNQPPLADCTLSADDTGEFIGSGVVDAQVTSAYVFNAFIELRTQALTGEDPFQRAVTVRGAEIEVAGTEFTQRFTAVLTPGGTLSASFIAVPNDVILEVGGGLGPGELEQITAEIQIFGSLGDGDVESNVFPFPVDVCSGCLQVGANVSCTEFVPPETMACLPGQDGFTQNCCTDSSGALLCPGVPESPPA